MNRTNTLRIRALAALPGLTLWFSGTVAMADDTEILTGQIGDYAAPNILFVIDTSGSMDGQVLVDESYDPTVVYDGPFTDPNRMYYTLNSSGGAINYPDEQALLFDAFVSPAFFACDAATQPLIDSGFYVDRMIQYDIQDNDWGFLENADDDPALSGANRFTECFRDFGLHGLDTTPSIAYPLDDEPFVPYTDNPDDPNIFDWSGYQLTYTVFSNNYLNWIAASFASGDPVLSTRLEVVKIVTRNLIDRLTMEVDDPRQTFNVGLMRFSTNAEGGMVLQPVSNVATSRDDIVAAVNSMTPSSNTPLSETLYEAYQYIRGAPVVFGLDSNPGPSVASSRIGDNYKSPIQASCQKNYVVLLTDGLPTLDNNNNPLIESVIGQSCSGNCLDDLAQYMNTADADLSMEDDQTVQTFTIGFFTDSNLLENAATGQVQADPDVEPTPGYFLADNVTDLAGAFDAIFTEIESDATTFTSPAVSVDSANRLINRNILYFTMFQPASRGEPAWRGNLKAYKIGRPGGPSDPNVAILDAADVEALEDDGTFRVGARSIWSAQADGGQVVEGGFASRLGNARTVVTDVAGNDLFALDNRVDETNMEITTSDLGIPVIPGPTGAIQAEARRQELLRFGRGVDEDGNSMRMMGDPLHTQPLVLTYANDELAIFVSTNDGYLHRLDPTPMDGDVTTDLEEWAYIPSELLPNLDVIERNPPALPNATQKLYGLDGPLTSLIVGDTNSVVDSDEQVMIYSAMRRGGTNYYALDLGTGGDSNPQLAFKISRGDPGFDRLGQTWSAATPARIRWGGSDRDVLIFAGGYDTRHDDNYVTGTNGNAIYIVDALDGTLLWRASDEAEADLTLAEMTYPIPSNVTVLDTNQDGLSDRLYVGDLGGQVWRFDMIDGTITGARHATLGDPLVEGDQRRFFNAPSVARVVTRTDDFLTIAIGSGWRAHPLATENNDQFYVLKDQNVFTPPTDPNADPDADPDTIAVVYPDPLTVADLFEITNLTNEEPADTTALQGDGGWMVKLAASGEKNLSEALIADNRVFFTTYSPESAPLGCQPVAAVGVGRRYVLDLFTGQSALVNGNGEPVPFEELDQAGGIPSNQELVFTEPACTANCDDGDPDNDQFSSNNGACDSATSEIYAFSGFEGNQSGICTAPTPTYWTETDEELGEL